jgi:hypothetical protein
MRRRRKDEVAHMTRGERTMLKAAWVGAVWLCLSFNLGMRGCCGELPPPRRETVFDGRVIENAVDAGFWVFGNIVGGLGLVFLTGGVLATRPRCKECQQKLKGPHCSRCGQKGV